MYKWANRLNYIGYFGTIMAGIAMLVSAVSRHKDIMLPALVVLVICIITGGVSDHYRLYARSADNPERRMNPGIMIFWIGVISIFVFLIVMPFLGLNGSEITLGAIGSLFIVLIASIVGSRDMNV